MAERSKAPVLKTGNGQPFVGSNPTPSAILPEDDPSRRSRAPRRQPPDAPRYARLNSGCANTDSGVPCATIRPSSSR